MADFKGMRGYADRIAEAMHRGPNPLTSPRRLSQALRADERHREIRGTSYGGVRQYVQGNIRRPRAELLRAIADVLGVRADWLLFDKGPMIEGGVTITLTPDWHRTQAYIDALHLKHAALEALGVSQAEAAEELERAVRAGSPTTCPPPDESVPAWVTSLLEVRRRFAWAQYERDLIVDPERAATDAICRALSSAISALGIDGARMQRHHRLDDYIHGMIPVLLALANERRQQRMEDVGAELKEATDG